MRHAVRRFRIPIPQDTFEKSLPQFPTNDRSNLYTRLLRLRREQIVPHLKNIVAEDARAVGPAAVIASWRFENSGRLTIACNFSDESITADLPSTPPVWGRLVSGTLPAASTLVWIDTA